MDTIRRLTKADLPSLRQFWIDYWGSEQMIMHGEVVRYDQVQGFIYGDWLGLLTYLLRGQECEVISLDSLLEGRGIGSRLIDELVREARQMNCRRVFLITTNDNLNALGFYQRRGFELVAVHRHALDETRRLKPTIPLVGENNIPLRDEIELELLV